MQKIKQQIERIERWREAFTDSTTGINTTVDDLLWKYAAYEMTVKIVKLTDERLDQGAALNQILFDLMRDGFWANLLIGTRRLLDKGSLKGPQGVYSIRSVVNDVRNSRSWLNRQMFVEHVKRAEYDLGRLQQENHKKLVVANGPIWGDKKLIMSLTAHKQFDELSGVTPQNRSRDDIIDDTIFTKIEARLAELENVADHTSTHVVHSGNVESRSIKKMLQNFDVRDARKTLKQLKEVSNLVGIWFANTASGDLATYLGDKFEALDQPMALHSDIAKLETHWAIIEQEIASWNICAKDL